MGDRLGRRHRPRPRRARRLPAGSRASTSSSATARQPAFAVSPGEPGLAGPVGARLPPRLACRREPRAPHRLAIGVAVFLSGAVLLGLEITASRVLAPTFGSSLYVWGSLIGIVLTGLAIGYWAGGIVADRLPTPVPARLRAHARRRPRRARARRSTSTVLAWIVELGSGPAPRSPARRRDPLRAPRASSSPRPRRSPSGSRRSSLERLGRTAGGSSRSRRREASSAPS